MEETMKPIHLIPISMIALAAALSAPALADPAPAPTQQGQIMAGPGDGAAGPLNMQENNSTYQQIQSPRDPASGQASGVVAPGSSDQGIIAILIGAKSPEGSGNPGAPQNQSVTAAPIMAGPGDGKDGPIAQATAIQSPRDPASGQATGIMTTRDGRDPDGAAGGATTGQSDRTAAPEQPNGWSLGASNPTAVGSEAGAGASAPTGYLKIEGVDGESVVQPSGNTSTTRKKPRRNRTGTRGKRVHKPIP
jgi:hypothetical protein